MIASQADNGGHSRGVIVGSDNAAQAASDNGRSDATVLGNMSAALADSVNGSANAFALGDDNLAEAVATDGAVVSDLATDGSGGAALQTAIFEVTALVTVLKAQIADKAMNAITQYINS